MKLWIIIIFILEFAFDVIIQMFIELSSTELSTTELPLLESGLIHRKLLVNFCIIFSCQTILNNLEFQKPSMEISFIEELYYNEKH